MRYLNKVVFVNSANTPYAEVRLDGNVHFIGTQGVGKSTLLRAILFFYNGDKLKLGIPKEKKGFDDFYLPHSNSYIVYEVAHEHGPFCVLVFRSQGRACFRFIDAPFERTWLVDELSGDVTSEYTVIRRRLEGKYMSRIVDKYDEYRNIIYGNHNATDREFYRFAFMESPKYQNIPRSLQNVFLNSRVDADFIKEIIIRSMSDDEVFIDLGYYRRQVAEFAQEYHDISIWFRPNAKGEVLVRTQADRVVTYYQQLLYHRERIIALYADLLYALRIARERIPLLEQKEQKVLADISKLERLISEEKQKFDKENAEINKMLGAVEAKLKEIRNKRKHYQEIKIEDILARVGAEEMVRTRLESLCKTRDALTMQFQSLSGKYEVLENTLKSEFKAYEGLSKEKISQLKDVAFKELERVSEQRERARTSIEREHADASAVIDEKAREQELRERDLDKELVRMNYFHPLADKIEAEKESLRNLRVSEASLRAESRSIGLEIDVQTDRFDAETALFERTRDEAVKELEREVGRLQGEMAEIDHLLSAASGSLYEWLDEHRKGWENNFGKVLDEKKVLYSKELKPTATNAPCDTIFGISLDLSSIESEVRTPTSLKKDKEMYENAIFDIRQHQKERIAQCDKDIEALTVKTSPQIKALREKKSVCEAKIAALPAQIKELEVRIAGLEDREKDILRQRLQELKQRKLQLSAEKVEIEKVRKALLEARDRKLKLLQKEYADSTISVQTGRDTKIGFILQDIEKHRMTMEKELSDLMLRRDAEMKGAGVDTLALKECENSIREVKAELKYIEEKRSVCAIYENDKTELFDREDELKDEKKGLETRHEQLLDKFRIRGRKFEEQKVSARSSLELLRADIQECREGVRKTEEFQTSETLFPAYLSSVVEHTTLSSAIGLVDELKNAIFERSDLMDKFKQAVNLFKANFGSGNTFKFKTNITVDDEYIEYAAGLEEFVGQNKIEDYRGRTSDRYMEILTRVSREMGEIMRHGSEVEKTIRDINYDFKEKNFVGAIKSIEIRRTDSGDKMVQLLLRIKEFSDDNQFRLGGINLFSDTGAGAEINRAAVRYLQDFMNCLNEYASSQFLSLSDTFQLQFRVVENDNDTGWVEKIANVGSDGTDILVKAMVNIMLINVFKEKVSRKFGEFRIHCMMDEIGKLHPSNVKGILDFANSRNILLINSSPTTYNVSDYRYTYLLSKNSASKTLVTALISRKEAELR